MTDFDIPKGQSKSRTATSEEGVDNSFFTTGPNDSIAHVHGDRAMKPPCCVIGKDSATTQKTAPMDDSRFELN